MTITMYLLEDMWSIASPAPPAADPPAPVCPSPASSCAPPPDLFWGAGSRLGGFGPKPLPNLSLSVSNLEGLQN